MLINLTLEKPAQIKLIGEPNQVEEVAIKIDGILSVFPHEKNPDWCTIYSIGLKDAHGNDIFPVVLESKESLVKRINDMYLQLATAKGTFVRTRSDNPVEGVVKFSDRGGNALVE